ncbi:MAG: hypothetical protein J5I93_21145 [Pirellulaceae bacterium]|nr:hypothetical protein [Pirellulaceae bacterium]
MDQQQRQARLRVDLETLTALKQVSPILDFSSTGQPPDRYTLVFRGRGLCREPAAAGQLVLVDEHRCELRLSYSYPEHAPDVRWLSPIFHPNVSFSGYINLRDIGIPWESRVGLDVVCERLWDVARFATLNLERAANFAAQNYFWQQTDWSLPTDPRPLRGLVYPSAENLVQYELRGQAEAPILRARPAADVLFIGEDTPVPPDPLPLAPVPRGNVWQARRAPTGPAAAQPGRDDDVLYIGDD